MKDQSNDSLHQSERSYHKPTSRSRNVLNALLYNTFLLIFIFAANKKQLMKWWQRVFSLFVIRKVLYRPWMDIVMLSIKQVIVLISCSVNSSQNKCLFVLVFWMDVYKERLFIM